MPGGFPLGLELCNGRYVNGSGVVDISSTITVNNTKGPYTQITAATAADCCFAVLLIGYFDTLNATVAVDFAVGSAGNEVVIVPNVLVCNGTGGGGEFNSYPICVPLQISAGTRIAARGQASDAASGVIVVVGFTTFDGAFTQMEGVAGFDAVGFTSATTLGTAVTNGTAPGPYVQITASTARDYLGFFLMADFRNAAIALTNNFTIEIAVGGAGSEITILPWLLLSMEGSSPPALFFPLPIPAGTRISARQVASSTSATVGITFYGAYQ